MTKAISHDTVIKGRCVGAYEFVTLRFSVFFVAEKKIETNEKI